MSSSQNNTKPSCSKEDRSLKPKRKYQQIFTENKIKKEVQNLLNETGVVDQGLNLDSQNVAVDKVDEISKSQKEILKLKRINGELKAENQNKRLMITKSKEQIQTATTTLENSQRKLKEANEKLIRNKAKLMSIALNQKLNNVNLQTDCNAVIEKLGSIRNKIAFGCVEVNEIQKENKEICEKFDALNLSIKENRDAITSLKEQCLKLTVINRQLTRNQKELESRFDETICLVKKLNRESQALQMTSLTSSVCVVTMLLIFCKFTIFTQPTN